MDLPKSILVGMGVVGELGSFLKNLGCGGSVHIVTGPKVMYKVKTIVEKGLKNDGFEFDWSIIDIADMKTVHDIEKIVTRKNGVILGLGGGKTVDAAKIVAYNTGLPFISIPTSASHDGIASPFASIKGLGKPFSFVAHSPLGIIADLDIISDAPFRLIASGCGDLIGKVTAVKDWELARDEVGEYYGKYSASLAYLSAELVLKESKNIGLRKKGSFRDVVEALISAGVAAGIAGSSRPCSGSEHLFAHALDITSRHNGLHGEKVGLGTILMAKLHNMEWEKIVKALEDIQAPTTGNQLNLDDKAIVKALRYAKRIRPDRYTILNKVEMDEQKAISLARSTNLI
jgi:glycerol-1-phosphate dehydrogenase [NAD(P)+]